MRRWLQDRLSRSGDIPSHALVGATIGDLDGPTAVIDDHGRVGSIDGSWWIEWGVRADERWRVAHDEVAVRQSRVADAPVYETWMRIPGGDVIQRVASANDGLGRVLVMEFENASGSAVAISVAGRLAGPASLTADADAVSLDDIEWIRGERPAGGVATTADDPWAGLDTEPDAGRSSISSEAPSGVLVFPLPHRQTIRIQILLDGEFPSREVTTETIAAGWRTVTAGALAIDVPDAELGEAWNRILPDLIVMAGSDDPRAAAEAATVLDVAGMHDEADRGRGRAVEAYEYGELSGESAVAALRALASRELLADTASGLAELVGGLSAAAGASLDAATLLHVARAIEVTAPTAAGDARRAAAVASATFEPATPAAFAAARVLSHVIDASDPAVIAVLPDVPESWRGQPIDVRSCGTPDGRVSFSVRWHGDRPALLWERLGGRDDVEMRCPGLDPDWSTLERSGEALLAAPQP